MRRLLTAILVLFALAPATASAAPAVSGEFPTVGTLSGAPRHLTQGSDGNIWAVLDNNNIAKVTPAGAVTEYTPAPALNNPSGITTGPDKNLWITQTNAVVRISPGNPTVDTKFTINEIGSPQGITTGPNGDLWTASDTHVIDIPLTNPETTYKHYEVVTGARGIARGGDGKLWVADFGGQRIVSVTTTGTPASYATAPTGGPMGTAAGPGTQIAFSDPIVQPEEVGLITPGGTPKRIVALGGSGDPTDIVFGNDGAYWFTRFGADDLLRLTPAGAQTALKGLGATSGPRYLTKGPGDTLWVGLETAKKIARITGVSAPPPPPPGGGGGGGRDTTAPVISALSLSHRTFRIGSLLPKLSRRVRVPVGTAISFRLSEASRVTLKFVQYANGRRKGSRCVRNRRSGRRCRITLVRGTLVLSGKAGANTLRFQGRITRRRTLAPGAYTLQLSARDAAGNLSKTKQTRLTLRR